MRQAGLALLLVVTAVAGSAAQALPDQPISLANGRVVLGAEVTATFAPKDPGFFNYTSYEFSALRNLRLGVSTEIKATERLQVLGEVRLDHGRVLEAYGLYVRIRPFPRRRFDIQAGRVPPTFGALSRTAYGTGNLLIGQPLAYQYLTSIRTDALPATADDLLRMRGRGWLSSFSVGNHRPGPGVPIVNTSRWDTGVQLHGVAGIFEWTSALTAGSLSDPRFGDNNHGRQLAGRVVARPWPSTVLGMSASTGAWLDRSLDNHLAAPAGDHGARQTAFAGDAEFSAGPFLVRGEAIRSSWEMPAVRSWRLDRPIVAIATLIEGRYKFAPGAYVALRGDRLDFSPVRGAAGPAEWDAQTWRLETAVAYSLTRAITVKAAWQKNSRDGGRVRKDALVAAQVMYWF